MQKISMQTLNDAFSFGWETFKKNYVFIIGAILALFIFFVIFELIIISIRSITPLYLLLTLLFSLAEIAVGIELTKMFIGLAKGEAYTFNTYAFFFKTDAFWQTYIKVFLLSLILGVAGFILYFISAAIVGVLGFTLYFTLQNTSLAIVVIVLLVAALVCAAIYIGTRIYFASPLVIYKDLNPITALQQSFTMTKGNVWMLVVFFIGAAIFNIVGTICLLVGLLVTIPVTAIAFIYLLLYLLGETGSATMTTPPIQSKEAPVEEEQVSLQQ